MTTIIAQIEEVLDQIRPAMEADGGGIFVNGYNDNNNTLYVKFQGACINCPSQKLTFQHGIEYIIKKNFPTIQAIEIV